MFDEAERKRKFEKSQRKEAKRAKRQGRKEEKQKLIKDEVSPRQPPAELAIEEELKDVVVNDAISARSSKTPKSDRFRPKSSRSKDSNRIINEGKSAAEQQAEMQPHPIDQAKIEIKAPALPGRKAEAHPARHEQNDSEPQVAIGQ